MDTAQWPQGIGVVNKPVDSGNPSTEKKPRPQKERALHCPRCSSTNTKFCYYNNYSLTQPRYFCKTCRRYWTEGGSLRNVPVGGGSRKNRRSSSALNNSSKKAASIIDNLTTPPNYYDPTPHHPFNGTSEFVALPSFSALDAKYLNDPQNPINSSAPVMELLKTGNMDSRGSFLSLPVHASNFGFPLHDPIKPSLSFSLDGFDQNVQGIHEDHANPSRNNGLFPFEESKPAEQDRGEGDQSNGFSWNGILARSSW